MIDSTRVDNGTSRREFLGGAAATVVGATLAPLASSLVNALPAGATPPPNIVVIMTDDQRSDEMWVMAKAKARLFDLSTKFTGFVVASSICQPSRASLITGQLVHNHHVGGNVNTQGDALLASTDQLPVWLQSAGYHTACVGKYLNSFDTTDPVPPGWNDFQGHCAGGSTGKTPFTSWTLNDNGTLVSGTRYLEDENTLRSVRSINTWRSANPAKPLFLYVGGATPHAGTNSVATRYSTSLSSWQPTWNPSFNEADVSDKPAWIRNLAVLDATAIASERSSELKRLRQLLAADDMVDSILTALGGDLSNTVVFFTSDNGYMRGEHRIRNGKTVTYEESLRVPMCIMGPGFPAGQTVTTVCSGVDLSPTICEIAGATPGRAQDGRSMLRHLDAPVAQRGRLVLVESGTYRAVRSSRWKYVKTPTGEIEMYDLLNDPFEMQSKHADPTYTTLRNSLAGYMSAMLGCHGANCVVFPTNIAPIASFAFTASAGTVQFNGSGSTDLDGFVSSYAWVFGDGGTSTATSPLHAFAASGTYTVSLTVTDERGATHTKTQAVAVQLANVPPTADFTYSVNDLFVSFDSSVSSDPDGTIVSAAWDFGDGATGTGFAPAHLYSATGSYTVTLTVTDDRGGTNTVSKPVAVTANLAPTAAFSYLVTGTVVDFDGSPSTDADGTLAGYSWEFGDSSSGTGVTTSHDYASIGTFVVVLTVTDNDGATGTDTQTITIP